MRGRRGAEASTSTSTCSTSSGFEKKCGVKKSGEKMEMFNHFYTNFERPPFAPVYYPTAEEFNDPIEYVSKIRGEAEKYGVIKIVPPSTFKPPFAIDKNTFVFRPRTQKLNEVEAIVKEKHTFIERLVNYNKMNGLPYELPFDSNNQLIDLHRLHRIVEIMGGCQVVNDEEKWKEVAKEMIIGDKTPKNIPNSFIKLLKTHYNNYVGPFIRNLEQRVEMDEDESDDEIEELKQKYQHHHGTMRNEKDSNWSEVEMEKDDCPISMQSGRRRSKQKKSTEPKLSRMMAGGIRKSTTSKRKRTSKEADDPMDTVFCVTCNGGENEELLLLCEIEECNNGRHTYCCDPPLDDVPKGEWRCPKCIQAEDAKIGLDWGFYDADVEYNLNSFTEYANKFKCDYFDVNDPLSVTCENVENEFWKNVISPLESVAVKYGADLITSRVGSGFPRKDDKFVGADAKLRQQYANHSWNLNNLPVLRDSVLSHIDFGISGMMVPWVYVGMCFSTFCWHTEDHWTYSINYNHWGERKIWYGIGGDDAEKFENALRKLAPGLTRRQRDLFHHMTTAANPALLRSLGVPIYTVHQNPGEFVITFPRAYHAGFNEGLNFAEAVNFAPVDWLYKGRLCMAEYSMVRRYCVFSHDELVFKMVEARDKLGISMSVATLDELMEISKREQTNRLLISQLGIEKSEKVMFENLQDDQRACRFCRTTIFLSGISCKHKKIVCLSHFDHLCRKCPIESCTLQFRYELDEFFPFIDQLENRTTEYYSWKSKTDMLLHEGDKPELRQIEELIDMAKQHHYPMTSHMQNLLAIRQRTRNSIEKANALLNGKVRTRVRTRIQRADTRLDVEGVRSFIEELKTMTCDMEVFIVKMERLVERVEEWRKRAIMAIGVKKEEEEEENEEKRVIRQLTDVDIQDIIREGEEFDLKLNEIELLNKAIEVKKWQQKANELIEWKSVVDMELDEDFEYKKRWTTEEVMCLIKDGNRLLKENEKDQLLALQTMLKNAHLHDSDAEIYMKEPDFSKVAETWASIRESDWFSDKNINQLRTEIYRVYMIVQNVDKIIGRSSKISLSDRFKMVTEIEIKYADIIEIGELCGESQIIEKANGHKKLLELKQKVENFTDKIGRLFKPNHSYHNLYEIISEREDLSALAEGQQLPKYLQPSTVSTSDEWNQINEFDSIKQMMDHQTSLRRTNRRILENLQTANSTRNLEACCCLGSLSSDQSESTLCCIICRANYHVKCCEWSPVFQNLPNGTFLCVRCLRGRRPALEDVQAICNGAPQNCYETHLVRHLINTSREISKEFVSSITEMRPNCREDLERCQNALIDFLSCEVLNTNALPRAVEMIQVFYADLIEQQTTAFEALRQKSKTPMVAEVLFAPRINCGGRRGKRNSSVMSKDPIGKKMKRRGRGTFYKHSDDQLCSVDECCRPYGDQVNWIMCESGCERWFHYVCVGLTVDDITEMPEYTCPKCVALNGSTGSPSSGSASSD